MLNMLNCIIRRSHPRKPSFNVKDSNAKKKRRSEILPEERSAHRHDTGPQSEEDRALDKIDIKLWTYDILYADLFSFGEGITAYRGSFSSSFGDTAKYYHCHSCHIFASTIYRYYLIARSIYDTCGFFSFGEGIMVAWQLWKQGCHCHSYSLHHVVQSWCNGHLMGDFEVGRAS